MCINLTVWRNNKPVVVTALVFSKGQVVSAHPSHVFSLKELKQLVQIAEQLEADGLLDDYDNDIYLGGGW